MRTVEGRQKRRELRDDDGFTLAELLVVTVILGILAAIALSVFLKQRDRARDMAVKTDLRNAATAEEAYLLDYYEYVVDVALLEVEGFTFSSPENYPGNSPNITVTISADSTSYCLTASSKTGGPFYIGSETPLGTTPC